MKVIHLIVQIKVFNIISCVTTNNYKVFSSTTPPQKYPKHLTHSMMLDTKAKDVRKLQTNITNKYKGKSPQQNTGKPNATRH